MNDFNDHQKRTLGLYLRLRHVNPTLGRLFGYNIKLYILLIACCVGIGVLFWVVGLSFVTPLMIAFVLGAFFRDIGYFRKTIQNWSVVREITDCEKAEALARRLNVK